MPLLEEDVNAMYPTEISLKKNKTNSGIFRVILMLYENLFFALLYSSLRRFYEYYILYREWYANHRTGFIKLEINIQIPDCTSDWCWLFHIFY